MWREVARTWARQSSVRSAHPRQQLGLCTKHPLQIEMLILFAMNFLKHLSLRVCMYYKSLLILALLTVVHFVTSSVLIFNTWIFIIYVFFLKMQVYEEDLLPWSNNLSISCFVWFFELGMLNSMWEYSTMRHLWPKHFREGIHDV